MRWRWLVLLGGLVACGGPSGKGGPGHGGGPDSEEVEVDPVTVVEVAPVARGDVSDVLVTSAVVESESQADLYPSASGLVLSVHKDEGDEVSAGDVLAVIDNASLDAGAERSRSELERLEKEYARLSELYTQGAISEREYTEAGYLLQSARTSAREASRSLGHTRIVAPFDGVVAARDIRVGELASSGRRAFQVVDLDTLRVVASLPEREVARVAVGQEARLVSAYDEESTARGQVARVAPVVDAASGTFRVTVGIDAEQRTLRPGQFVSVELEVGRHEGVLVVPRKAVVYEDGLPVVYRMIPKPPDEEKEADEDEEKAEEGGGWLAKWGISLGGADADEKDDPADEEPREVFVAERVLVDLGLIDDQRAEIDGGLAEADEVIVVGQSNLKDGAVVRTPEMQAEEERRAEEAAKKASPDDAEGEG